jgi:CRISPR-associated protein Cas2
VDEHLYIISYDIADSKRWRRVFKLMEGHGEWLQLSVFQCRLSRRRHAELVSLLDGIIHHDQDHVIALDLGVAEQVSLHVVSLGKDFQAVRSGQGLFEYCYPRRFAAASLIIGKPPAFPRRTPTGLTPAFAGAGSSRRSRFGSLPLTGG